MNRNKIILPVIVSLLCSILFFVSPKTASAITFDDIVTGVKSFIPGNEKPDKETKIESSITLAPDGDFDKNGQIDSGDIVRFTYKISNNTDNNYAFATLETNIDKSKLNFIHNVSGATGVNNDRKTVTIPNLRIRAKQTAIMSFDARINYDTQKETSISTEANFISKDKKTIIKSLKKEIQAKPIKSEKLRKNLNKE